MKSYAVILICMMFLVPHSGAQVSVDLSLDQEQFLQDETLPVNVRIVNRSGQTLVLGDDPDWLTFTVERSENNLPAPRKNDVPVVGQFVLESSQMASRLTDLMPYYDLKPGRYHVTATVKIPAWGKEIRSGSKLVEIIRGTKIWETVVGIPGGEGLPEARKYVLQQAHYLRQLYLYLRLTDENEQRVFRVMPLGRLTSFGRPEAQIDRESNLHVLFRTGARSFVYDVINPQGEITIRQRHDYTATRPTLKSSGTGDIAVVGGARYVTPNDLPPPPPVSTIPKTNEVQIPDPQ